MRLPPIVYVPTAAALLGGLRASKRKRLAGALWGAALGVAATLIVGPQRLPTLALPG